jgi:hypothetical protein
MSDQKPELDRRSLIKAGIVAVPVILTLRARPLRANGSASLGSYGGYPAANAAGLEKLRANLPRTGIRPA